MSVSESSNSKVRRSYYITKRCVEAIEKCSNDTGLSYSQVVEFCVRDGVPGEEPPGIITEGGSVVLKEKDQSIWERLGI